MSFTMSSITVNCDLFVINNLFKLHEQGWLQKKSNLPEAVVPRPEARGTSG